MINSNFISFSADVIKSGKEENGKIPIEIIPNHPSFDRQNEKILLKAFDDECIKSFLYDGVIDFDHLSILGQTSEVRATAIIGEPTDFFIDEEKEVPVCKAFLFKTNPYVKNAILPAIENDSKVWAASLGGKTLRKSMEIDPVTNLKKGIISKIKIAHIAITPKQKAVHQKTSVKLLKSLGMENKDINAIFDTYEDFVKSFTSDDILKKALMAGSETDIANISGGQVLQTQSLEGSPARINGAMPFILENYITGRMKGNYNECTEYLIQRGFSKKEAEQTVKILAKNGASILKIKI